jgi:hypothetical protein
MPCKNKSTKGERDVITSAPLEHPSPSLDTTGASDERWNDTRTTRSSDNNSTTAGTESDGNERC